MTTTRMCAGEWVQFNGDKKGPGSRPAVTTDAVNNRSLGAAAGEKMLCRAPEEVTTTTAADDVGLKTTCQVKIFLRTRASSTNLVTCAYSSRLSPQHKPEPA